MERNLNKPGRPATKEAPRFARVTIENPVPCFSCGTELQAGESALKLTTYPEDTDGMTKTEIKDARTFSYYHNHCVPRDTSESNPNDDAMAPWRRAGGSFESGSR